MQQRRFSADIGEHHDHRQDQKPQNDEPRKRKPIPLPVEKEDGPQQVKHQLNAIDEQRIAFAVAVCIGSIDQVSRNSHEQK